MPHRLSPNRESAVISTYLSGSSISSTAESEALAIATVRAILGRNGVVARSKADYVAPVVQRMLTMYDAGMSCRAISKRIGYTDSAVRYHVRKVRTIRRGGLVGPDNPSYGKKLPSEQIKQRTATRKARYQRRSKHRGLHPVLGITEATWLRDLIRSRGGVCIVTGQRKGLSAHHICNVKHHPEQQWDESNIVVVSLDLHKEFHAKFMGSSHRKTTPDDWSAFLESKGLAASNTLIAGVGRTHEVIHAIA
jgi:5-methylcytosine-specific restriction endonuclease McrA